MGCTTQGSLKDNNLLFFMVLNVGRWTQYALSSLSFTSPCSSIYKHTMESKTKNVPISERPHLIPIDFGESVFYEGDFAQANCVLQKGDQPIKFSWIFNGVTLESSSEIQIDYIGRSSILTLDPVRGVHQGTYTCVASNPAGEEQMSANLTVNGTQSVL